MPTLARLSIRGVALALVCSCAGGSAGGGDVPDRPPVIDGFTVGTTAVVGDGLPVVGAAHDPDGDAVTYAWTVEPAGCGTFAAPAAASTTFTPAAAGSCTVELTVTAGGKTARRSQGVGVTAPCTGAGCAPQNEFGLDPIAAAPGGRGIWASDTGSRAVLIQDRAPGAAGDILGLFYAQGGGGAVWYLLRSADRGATFQYLMASNAEPNAAADAQPWSYSLAQDTSGYEVHLVWSGSDAGAASATRYSRIALARDGSGHVSGWSWEAQNVAGPTFDTTSSWSGFAKVEVKEILDGDGNRLLAIVGMDQPSDTCVQRLRLCRTVPGATALAPTGTADWRKATDATVQGCDVVASYSTGGAADAECAGASRDLTGQSYDWMREHTADFTFAQQPTDRSLHLFDGPMYYNDAFSSSNPGDIRRWRLAASGGSWVNDAAVNGTVLASGDATTRATLGSAYATANHVWLVYGEPTAGLHIGRSEAGSGWTADAVRSPDSTAHAWWWTALSVNADETRVYAYWETYQVTGSLLVETAGYYGGEGWSATDVSAEFARDADYRAGAQPGGDAWCPIQLAAGVGVLTYPFSQWLSAAPSYHLHVMQ